MTLDSPNSRPTRAPQPVPTERAMLALVILLLAGCGMQKAAPVSARGQRFDGMVSYAYPALGYPACVGGWCWLRCPVQGEDCYL
ncbi:MAG TPA: hypothetical protein VFS33_10560 [Gemmatimonadales bacterium]|nr:hypothetical protein [Gemmatimonadales bacterium]